MIEQLHDMPAGVIGMRASGTVTAADYKQTLIPAVEQATQGGGKVRIFLEFAGDFDKIDAGAMWEDAKTGISEWSSWERIALVTDSHWMRDGLRMFAWAIPGDAKAFPSDQREQALEWVARPKDD